MAGVWGGHGEDAGQRGPPEVIVHVQHVGEQRLGGRLLDVKLLHLLRHHDCLPRDLLPGPSHLHQPRQPLEIFNNNKILNVHPKTESNDNDADIKSVISNWYE